MSSNDGWDAFAVDVDRLLDRMEFYAKRSGASDEHRGQPTTTRVYTYDLSCPKIYDYLLFWVLRVASGGSVLLLLVLYAHFFSLLVCHLMLSEFRTFATRQNGC
jgi:hypothetical protein